MRVVFFGSGAFAVPCLRWLANSSHETALVVTQPPRPAGRGLHPVPTPVHQWAGHLKLPVTCCSDVNEPGFVEQVRKLGAQIGVVIDFGQKLGAPLREAFPSQCINLHASLLPRYRGASPIARAILAGDEITGVSVFRMVDRMDAGPILIRRQTRIGPYETQQELHDRLAGVACDALDAALQLHEKDPLPPGEPQDESQVVRAPKLSKRDGLIDFTAPAEHIGRLCRAMYPWPGARCRYVRADGQGTEVTLVSVSPNPTSSDLPPGTLTEILTVATGVGTLEIHSLQPAGKKLMSWRDFVNGRRVRPGDRMESLA